MATELLLPEVESGWLSGCARGRGEHTLTADFSVDIGSRSTELHTSSLLRRVSHPPWPLSIVNCSAGAHRNCD